MSSLGGDIQHRAGSPGWGLEAGKGDAGHGMILDPQAQEKRCVERDPRNHKHPGNLQEARE